MKKIIKFLLVSIFLYFSYYSISYSDNFSNLNGDLKIKCVTTDKSKISTIKIIFDGTDKPKTFIDNNEGTLVSAPPYSEDFNVFYKDVVTERLAFLHRLKFDSTLMIGEITMTTISNGKAKAGAIYGQIECIMLTNNTSIEGNESEKSGSSGTAFFINNSGHLLTNNHVVEGCSLSKISYKNNDYDAKLIATDKTLDLALLKADLKSKSFFTFSKDETKKLSKIYVAGYPLGKGLSDDLKITSGIVSSLKGFDDNSNEIQIDAPINPGNSGGPIINENGDLIAIAVSGLAKDQTEGINFGIKSSAAETFLKTNKINPKKSMYSGIKNNDKLLEILEESTVYTYCN